MATIQQQFFTFAIFLQVFAAPLIFKSLAKTCKIAAKIKHHVGIIKSAVFLNSLPQNQKRIRKKSDKK